MRASLALMAAAVLGAAAQDVPLPNSPDGFRYGQGQVVVEGFLDLMCPDCAGEWPTIQQLMKSYNPNTELTFILHTFPLPYHTFAFRLAQGAHVIKSINGTDAAVFDFATLMFQQQDNFAGPGLNQTYVDNLIAQMASQYLGYSAAAVAQGLADDNINEATRISWKYGCSRYTTGTPHFLVNGIPVDDILGDGSLASWQAIINPLLQSGGKAGKPAGAAGSSRVARFARKAATFKHDL